MTTLPDSIRPPLLDDANVTLPNFIVIGAMKSGTTSLYAYLNQHPQIYMSPQKETNFFAFEGETLDYNGPGFRESYTGTLSITDFQAYQRQFAGVTDERAIGEISPTYLYYADKSAQGIQTYIPKTKLITILRDPAERAFSHFLHMMRDHREPLANFRETLKAEADRINQNWAVSWHYQQLGFYHRSLSHYLQQFDKKQMRVYLFEDFKRDPQGVVSNIFDFLEVDTTIQINSSKKHNVSNTYRSRRLHQLIMGDNVLKRAAKRLIPSRLRRQAATQILTANKVKPKLSPEMRHQLIELYREDILKLQDLIKQDLSTWLVV